MLFSPDFREEKHKDEVNFGLDQRKKANEVVVGEGNTLKAT